MKEKYRDVRHGEVKDLMDAMEERAFFKPSARKEVKEWQRKRAESEPAPQEVQEERERKARRTSKIVLACLGIFVVVRVIYFMWYV